MDTHILTWFLIGFIAGLGDYTLAIGYGLCASIIAVSIFNISPKCAVAAIVTSQAISSLPALLFHYRARNIVSLEIPRPLIYFLVLTSMLAFIFAHLFTQVPRNVEKLLYSLVLLSALILMELKKRFKIRNRYMISLFAVLAALDKSIIGGGLSLIFVVVQSSLGIGIREAIASTPLLKLLPTFATFIGYMTSMNHFPWLETLFMTLGAVLSTPLSSKLLYRFKASEGLLKMIIVVAIIISMIRSYWGL